MNANTKKQFYFLSILLGVALLIYVLVDIILDVALWIKILLIVLLALILFFVIATKTGALLFLSEYERALVYRFGRTNRLSGPGWALIIPWIEKADVIELRAQTIDIPKQDVITKDNVMLNIDAVIYMRINKEPKEMVKSILNVENYRDAAQIFVKSQIRDVIGTMTLNDVIGNINDLNVKIKSELQMITKDWGIVVDSVEVKEVKIPDAVIDAMHKQKAAVQRKLAAIEEAEGEREKIKAINSAASELSDKSLSYYYIKALEEMSRGSSTKIIFPMEFTKLANILAGKLSPKSNEKEKVDDFLEHYGPLLANYLKEQKK